MTITPHHVRKPDEPVEFSALHRSACPLLDRYGDRCARPSAAWSQTGACEDHMLAAYREVQEYIRRRAPQLVHSTVSKR